MKTVTTRDWAERSTHPLPSQTIGCLGRTEDTWLVSGTVDSMPDIRKVTTE